MISAPGHAAADACALWTIHRPAANRLCLLGKCAAGSSSTVHTTRPSYCCLLPCRWRRMQQSSCQVWPHISSGIIMPAAGADTMPTCPRPPVQTLASPILTLCRAASSQGFPTTARPWCSSCGAWAPASRMSWRCGRKMAPMIPTQLCRCPAPMLAALQSRQAAVAGLWQVPTPKGC